MKELTPEQIEELNKEAAIRTEEDGTRWMYLRDSNRLVSCKDFAFDDLPDSVKEWAVKNGYKPKTAIGV